MQYDLTCSIVSWIYYKLEIILEDDLIQANCE